jgi:hypothetical protein
MLIFFSNRNKKSAQISPISPISVQKSHAFSILKAVIENDPPTTASLKNDTFSFSPRKARAYNIGK